MITKTEILVTVTTFEIRMTHFSVTRLSYYIYISKPNQEYFISISSLIA